MAGSTWRELWRRRCRADRRPRSRRGGCSKRPAASTGPAFCASSTPEAPPTPRPGSSRSSHAACAASPSSTCSATGAFADPRGGRRRAGARPASRRPSRSSTLALSELDRPRGDPPGRALVADLGTGSGVIALSLVAERALLRVVATDHDPAALEVAAAQPRRGSATRGGGPGRAPRGRLVPSPPGRAARVASTWSSPTRPTWPSTSGRASTRRCATSTRTEPSWPARAGSRRSRRSWPARPAWLAPRGRGRGRDRSPPGGGGARARARGRIRAPRASRTILPAGPGCSWRAVELRGPRPGRRGARGRDGRRDAHRHRLRPRRRPPPAGRGRDGCSRSRDGRRSSPCRFSSRTRQALAELARRAAAARLLAERYWPGPLTFVLDRQAGSASSSGAMPARSGCAVRRTSGARAPSATGPLAVTSANRHGEPLADRRRSASSYFGGEVTACSTAVAATAGPPRWSRSPAGPPECLREGAIAFSETRLGHRGSAALNRSGLGHARRCGQPAEAPDREHEREGAPDGEVLQPGARRSSPVEKRGSSTLKAARMKGLIGK